MDAVSFNPDGVGVDNGNYFGMPFLPQDAALVLLSAPWDVTVSYGAGAVYAPDAIIAASTQLDLYDAAAPNQWQRGIATVVVDYALQESSLRLRSEAVRVIEHFEAGRNPDDETTLRRIRHIHEGCMKLNETIYKQACHWLDAGKLVGLVGGDHSTPYGLIRAMAERHTDLGILHIDAHCDLREAYEGFEFSHASIMYNVLRDCPSVSKIVEVGVRDFCDAEAERAATDARITMFADAALATARFEGTSWKKLCEQIVEALPHEVYVSFDIDGLSIEHCPHTGTPVPGGLDFNQAVYLLETLVRSGRRIVGFDVVEVVPQAGEKVDEIIGARILYKLCGQTLQSNSL
ncbi:MAG: agmatinase family protein [Alistipes sp.]